MSFNFVNEPESDFSRPEIRQAMLDAFKVVDSEKGLKYPLVINGERVMKENVTASLNPSDCSEVIGYASSGDVEDVDNAIEAAYAAFQTWRYTTAAERVEYAQKIVKLLQKNRFYLNAWIVEESGKKWDEAEGEVCETIDFFNAYCAGMLELDKGLQLQKTAERTRCIYTPIGVGIAIAPWNFPLALMAGMVAGAIISGNTVVIKPAECTPVVAHKFVELIEQAGVPKGVVNLVTGRGSVIGDRYVTHPKTRFINFTGSKEVGVRINKMAADIAPGQIWLKRVVAEMGGKNAIIVDKSADIKKAATGVIVSAFSFQGQKCSACSRAIVHADVYDKFVDELLNEAAKIKQGAGREDTFSGPVSTKRAYDSIVSYIEIAKKEGKIVFGGTYDDSKGYYIMPTIVRDVDAKARIAVEEIFGPVLAVIKVNSFDEALQVANDTEYGLTGAVYSKDEANIERAKREFYVGNLYFNRKSTGAVVQQHPFGGYNMSGTAAKTGTKDYLLNFLHLKSIAENLEQS